MTIPAAIIAAALANASPPTGLAEGAPAVAVAAEVAAAEAATVPGQDVPASPAGSPAPRPGEPGGGDIVVAGRRAVPEDPLAGVNVAAYGAIQAADTALIGPVATGYRKGVPEPVRDGLRNFLRNVKEPVVFVNYLLQLKPGKAVRTVGRFALNTTLGVAGLVDVAKRKPFRLPWRNNGFANTLACYGVKPGAYLFLPLVGSTSIRDLVGLGLDRAFVPTIVGHPFDRPAYAIPAGVIDSLNDRIEIDAQLAQLRKESDPYAASRTLYLQQRAAEVEGLCGRRKNTNAPPLP